MMFAECSHQAKTLAVSNNDSTTDVIRMALQQFGISVSKDHLYLLSSSDWEGSINSRIEKHCACVRHLYKAMWFLDVLTKFLGF